MFFTSCLRESSSAQWRISNDLQHPWQICVFPFLRQMIYFISKEIASQYILKQNQSVHRSMVWSPNWSKSSYQGGTIYLNCNKESVFWRLTRHLRCAVRNAEVERARQMWCIIWKNKRSVSRNPSSTVNQNIACLGFTELSTVRVWEVLC